MLVKSVNANRGWWAARSFLGSDNRNGIRRVGCTNFILSNNSQVICGGRSQVENASYVLLRSRYQYSVNVSFPRAFADFIFNDIAFYGAVSVVWCCPG